MRFISTDYTNGFRGVIQLAMSEIEYEKSN